MPGPLLVLKAYKLKRAAKRLMKAKENALRIYRGERPHYPWYEETWTWCVECLKNNFCKAFCPCWLARKKRKDRFEDSYSKSFLRRPCLDGTFENYAIKSFLGFVFGLLLTAVAFFFFLDQLNINPRITTAFCCVLGMVLSTALAFSENARCITFLALPELFSGRGRMVLMAITYILVMSGPAKNAMRNANILVESMNCGQEILIKQTKAILSSIFAPLIAIIDTMRDILAALKSFARQVKDAFIAIRDLFMEIINAIRNMFRWLQSMVNVCNNKYGTPYQRCNKAFDDAIEDCNKKMGVFNFLCYIVNVVQYVCEIAKIVDLLCLIPKAVKSGIIEPLKELPAVVQIQVKGDGVMADLYRQMVTRFDPLMSSVPEFDTAQCLPVPLPVDLDRYQRIGIMYGICLLLAVTQSYGLRLRHVICGCYYPQREKARAIWLYNHILKTRGSLQKFLSNQIRRRVYGDDTVDKISFLERLSHQSKLIARILKAAGYIKIYCVCCNEAGKPEDFENFKRCSTPGCKGIYCLPCFEDIRNVCELCTKPVEYEDPDFSEEKWLQSKTRAGKWEHEHSTNMLPFNIIPHNIDQVRLSAYRMFSMTIHSFKWRSSKETGQQIQLTAEW